MEWRNVSGLAHVQNQPGLNFNVCRLSLGTAGRLMNHNLRIRQRKPLALGAAGQQERSHRTGLSDAHGRYVAADVLHGIVHCHAGRNNAAGRVNVQKDVLFGILGFQKQKLSANQRRNFVVNLSGQKNNPFFQQARKDVKRALALGCLLYTSPSPRDS